MEAATAANARPGSASISDSTNSSSGASSGASPPDAATTSSADKVSRAEPPPRREDCVDRTVGDVEAGVLDHPPDVGLELVHRQEVELQVLRARADGLAHLLRIGGGEHEHHVRRRLLQRLQQGRFRRLRQHVHLVEDVHLVPPGLPSIAFSIRSRIASTPLLLAASSSWTS